MSEDFDRKRAELTQSTIRSLERSEGSLRRTLAEWSERFSKNPLDAFRWATGAIEASAELELTIGGLGFLTGAVNPDFQGDRLAVWYDELVSEVTRNARDQRWGSSSMMSNITEEAQRIARAKMVERLRRMP